MRSSRILPQAGLVFLVVGTAGAVVTLKSDGTGMATVATKGTIASVSVNANQIVLPGRKQDLVKQIALTANDLVYDPASRRIYATVPSRAGSRGNSVTIIDPSTGTIEKSIPIGSEPNRLALSGDGEYLYVALDGSASVVRFDMTNQLYRLVSDGGQIFTSGGQAIDPETASVLGTFDLKNTFYDNAYISVRPDTVNEHVYFLYSSYSTSRLLVYNSRTFALVGEVALPYLAPEQTGSLIRWGEKGLAFRSGDKIYLAIPEMELPTDDKRG